VHPPLLLTGGPASGKTATAQQIAETLKRAAVIDVDDIRHLVVAGHAAPWEGDEGALQQRLGVENACTLAHRFLEAGIDVVICDVATAPTLQLYRDLLPHVVIVRLRVTLAEARCRARLRPVHLTAAEFETLHSQQPQTESLVDHVLDVDRLSIHEQADAVITWWISDSAAAGR
jgi:predicted kinase